MSYISATNMSDVYDNITSDSITANNITTNNLSIGSLSGVLKAIAGTVLGSATTSDLPELSNLYFTSARARSALTGSTGINYDVVNGVIANAILTTDQLVEGKTNLYFTNARARSALTGSTGINYDAVNGIISTSGFVTSVAGTANQVLVNGSTGPQTASITLSLPQSIATTSNPVFASITATGSANSTLIQGTFRNTSSGTSAVNEIRVLNDTSLGLRLGMTSSTYTGWLGDSYIWNSANAGINFGTNNTGNRLYIASAGNVGIGTNTPSAKLHVEDLSTHLIARTYRPANGTDWGSGIAFALNNSANARTDYAAVFGAVESAASSHGYMSFHTTRSGSATEKMRITSNGNVSIGYAWNPDVRLQVLGTAMSTSVETEHIFRLFRGGTASVRNPISAGLRVGSFEAGVNGRGRLDVVVSSFPGAGNQWGTIPDLAVATFNGDGNVGIQNTNPTATLDVARGSAGDGTALFRGTTNISYFHYGANEHIYIRGGKSNSRIYMNDIGYGTSGTIQLGPHTGNLITGINIDPTVALQIYHADYGGQIGIGQQNDNTPYMNLGMDTSWVQYICNNARWTGSAYNYVNTFGYGGTATRIAQVGGDILFDTASGGTNPITWSRRMTIVNNGTITVGGNFSANNVTNGSYVPSTSSVSGMTVSSVEQHRWMRVGNCVTFSGRLNCVKVGSDRFYSCNINLPISGSAGGNRGNGTSISLIPGMTNAGTGTITAINAFTATIDHRDPWSCNNGQAIYISYQLTYDLG